MLQRLFSSLEFHGPLADDARRDLQALSWSVRRQSIGADLFAEEGPQDYCHLLVSGQAFKHCTFADGRRQIVMFLTPGDLCDLQGLWLPLDYGVIALSRCEVATVRASRLRATIEAHPQLAAAFWRLSFREAAIQRQWMVCMGRRSAFTRVAHLLCEVFVRMGAAHAVDRRTCDFPASQQQIADALGLSIVHTNRVVQALRRTGVIVLRSGRLSILDWEGLKLAGQFDGSYLNVREAAHAEPAR